jgi:hypothetical protein
MIIVADLLAANIAQLCSARRTPNHVAAIRLDNGLATESIGTLANHNARLDFLKRCPCTSGETGSAWMKVLSTITASHMGADGTSKCSVAVIGFFLLWGNCHVRAPRAFSEWHKVKGNNLSIGMKYVGTARLNEGTTLTQDPPRWHFSLKSEIAIRHTWKSVSRP